ncbi:MAG: sulfatase-like hydrolase/transferase [Verrucomicrobiia bacterium]
MLLGKKNRNKTVNARRLASIPGFVFILLLILSFSANSQPLRRLQPKGAYGKPNIILFAADNFTFSDLETALKEKGEFKNINKIVSEGLFFSRVYTPAPLDRENRAALLTGIHPVRKPLSEFGALNPQFQTLSQILKNAGYKTGILGVWALGENPLQKGFDQWFGYLTAEEATNNYPPYLWRNDKKWELPENSSDQKTTLAHYWFIRTTTNFIRVYREYPFFLYLPSNLPGKVGSVPVTKNPGAQTTKNSITDDRKKALKLVDEHLGRLFEYLEYYKLTDKTVLIFTSIVDPGFVLKEESEKSKPLKDFEKLFHTPMFIFGDGCKPGTNSMLLYTFDLTPTLLELADAAILEQIDGAAFTKALFYPDAVQKQGEILILKVMSKGIQYMAIADNAVCFLDESEHWQVIQLNETTLNDRTTFELQKIAASALEDLKTDHKRRNQQMNKR